MRPRILPNRARGTAASAWQPLPHGRGAGDWIGAGPLGDAGLHPGHGAVGGCRDAGKIAAVGLALFV